MSATAPDRRQQLLRLSLRAVVADLTGDQGELVASDVPGGAWLVRGDTLWARLDERPHRAIGSVIALALREGVERLEVLVGAEDAAPIVARRARQWNLPISVRHLDERTPVAVEPAAHVIAPTVPEAHLAFTEAISAAGADPVVAHGALTAQFRGLEIARVIDDGDGARLEVGVGANDREAFRELHIGEAPEAALARVVRAVAGHRVDGARPHPFTTMSPEGYLASALRADPGVVGVGNLALTGSAVAPVGAVDAGPVMLIGGGRLFACTTGVDLGAMPDALDTLDAMVATGEISDPALTVIVPSRNRLPVLDRLAAAAVAPVPILQIR